mmetsp:Transcript_61711/g.201391  ORF Transcript_61711/g.201391 Transcript_61711/m.201391 type:complete len:360 (+) Transcript_61711:434-1513(+)
MTAEVGLVLEEPSLAKILQELHVHRLEGLVLIFELVKQLRHAAPSLAVQLNEAHFVLVPNRDALAPLREGIRVHPLADDQRARSGGPLRQGLHAGPLLGLRAGGGHGVGQDVAAQGLPALPRERRRGGQRLRGQKPRAGRGRAEVALGEGQHLVHNLHGLLRQHPQTPMIHLLAVRQRPNGLSHAAARLLDLRLRGGGADGLLVFVLVGGRIWQEVALQDGGLLQELSALVLGLLQGRQEGRHGRPRAHLHLLVELARFGRCRGGDVRGGRGEDGELELRGEGAADLHRQQDGLFQPRRGARQQRRKHTLGWRGALISARAPCQTTGPAPAPRGNGPPLRRRRRRRRPGRRGRGRGRGH